MKYAYLALCTFLLVAGTISAAELGGVVVDRDNKAIPGVNIQSHVKGLTTVTDEHGRFTLQTGDSLPAYITFSHVSYQPHLVNINKHHPAQEMRIILDQAVYPTQNIRVTAMRAQAGKTPVAFFDVTEEDIERDYTVGDFPLLLETTPNMYAYSYTGGAVGASEYKIRGFDSKRIGVYINGVPLNDPEDHFTYFYDLPDFAANVTDIQVQRGVGNSLYGDATFGGSINISSSGLNARRKITVTSGYGRYYADGDFVSEMRKTSVEYLSGLIDGRWLLSGRYSKLYSGGYRENSWYDGWSYYFSLSRLDDRMITTANLYGGPFRAHLAFDGIDRETMQYNRRANWSWYPNEIDDFSQPHYELHNSFRVNQDLTLLNTLYYIRGRGYYEGFKDDKTYYEYNIPEYLVIDDEIDEISLVRRKWVSKNQYGWNPRLEWQHHRGSATFGGALYYFNSEHWGEITWAQNVAIAPDYKYYVYNTEKYSGAIYAVESYRFTDRLRLTGNLQLRYLVYDFNQPAMGVYEGHTFDLGWLFLSPHLGMTYQLHPNADLYANFAISSRESDDALIFDADNPYAKPALDADDKLLADAERVFNFELGANWHDTIRRLGLSLFWMEFRNEIIQAAGVDDDGRPLLTNANRSVHAGIEFSGDYRVHRHLTISGNAAYNYNRLKKYVVENDNDWDGVIDETLDYSDNPIAGFPDAIGNLIFDAAIDPVRLVYRVRAIGRQYIENGKDKAKSIDPYSVSSITASLSLGRFSGAGRLTLSGAVNNLFNEKYELTGVVYDGVGYYIPAAERNFFVQLVWELE